MDNILQTALAEAVNSLASFFGTTTETIIAHAPDFLEKYGWYSTLNELPLTIFGTILIATLICLIGWLFDLKLKHRVLVIVGIFILCLVIGVGIKIITCAVAPEIVGIHAIMRVLEYMG